MTRTATPTPVYGVLPAAGMSRRMGTPKQSLPYGASTMTGHVARTMLAANLDAVVVVTRTELVGAIDLPEDQRLLLAINDAPMTQMMDSIRLGLDTLESAHRTHHGAGIFVIPADMPTVPVAACVKCVDTFRANPTNIIIATCHGSRGHPIIFPLALQSVLDAITGGLNELPLRRADLVLETPIDDPAILRDVDTVADYERLSV